MKRLKDFFLMDSIILVHWRPCEEDETFLFGMSETGDVDDDDDDLSSEEQELQLL